MATIVIDPGHGGTSNIGHSDWNHAVGPNGRMEKELTLDVSIRLTDALTGLGHNVLITRNSDQNLSLKDRAGVASSNNAAVFVSIHFNGFNDPNVQGVETWAHSVSTDDSRLLAASLLQQLAAVTGYSNRGIRSKGLGVLSMAYHSPTTAAALAEISFLTDPKEEKRLAKAPYRDQLAAALAQAIVDFLNKSTSIVPVVPKPDGNPTGDSDN
jgi:N-acetylmuramoyl-L-alanine amidase